MNQTDNTKQTYEKPSIEVIHALFGEQLMQQASFSNNGGHNDSNDDGQDLNAKQGFFDEEDEDATSEPKFGSIW